MYEIHKKRISKTKGEGEMEEDNSFYQTFTKDIFNLMEIQSFFFTYSFFFFLIKRETKLKLENPLHSLFLSLISLFIHSIPMIDNKNSCHVHRQQTSRSPQSFTLFMTTSFCEDLLDKLFISKLKEENFFQYSEAHGY